MTSRQGWQVAGDLQSKGGPPCCGYLLLYDYWGLRWLGLLVLRVAAYTKSRLVSQLPSAGGGSRLPPLQQKYMSYTGYLDLILMITDETLPRNLGA